MSDHKSQGSSDTRPLWGPGAPNNNDWHEVIEAIQAKNQGEDLPASGTFTLSLIPSLLKEAGNFDEWYNVVIQILQNHGLDRLIDLSFPRPMRNAVEAENWMKCSMQVRAWLYRCIDSSLAQEITTRAGRTAWADEFMHECRAHMKGKGHRGISEALMELLKIEHSEFDTAEEFVTELKRRFRNAKAVEPTLPPYYAVVILITELSQIPDMADFTDVKEAQLQQMKNPVKEVAVRDFFAYCSDAVHELDLVTLM
jgi:hypothetical protein